MRLIIFLNKIKQKMNSPNMMHMMSFKKNNGQDFPQEMNNKIIIGKISRRRIYWRKVSLAIQLRKVRKALNKIANLSHAKAKLQIGLR